MRQIPIASGGVLTGKDASPLAHGDVEGEVDVRLQELGEVDTEGPVVRLLLGIVADGGADQQGDGDQREQGAALGKAPARLQVGVRDESPLLCACFDCEKGEGPLARLMARGVRG